MEEKGGLVNTHAEFLWKAKAVLDYYEKDFGVEDFVGKPDDAGS